ncbi:MAG: FG-GAP-like repeat-containing protein, partial [Solirubrobacteraceae bacterium]|nr:FG-GAP-like repeat-containing protein [Solirubrobacteraceae bacterium]
MRSLRGSVLLSLLTVAAFGVAVAPAQAVTFSPWPGSPFEAPAGNGAGFRGAGIQPVDLNADPAPDLVATASDTNGFYTLGAPTFVPRIFRTFSVTYPSGSAGADVDGDGRLDAFVWGSTDKAGGPTATLRGTGDGPVDVPGPDYGTPLRDAALADFDADGRLDLFAAEDTAVSVRIGKPGPAFSPRSVDGAASAGPLGPSRIAARDVTGDGKADLLFGQVTRGGLISLRTAPALDAAGVVLGVGTIQDLFLANVGGDARPEAVVVTSDAVKVYPVTSAGQFGAPVTTAVTANGGPTDRPSAAADFDADGFADVVVPTGAQDRVQLLRSKGDGSFEPPKAVLLPAGARRGAIDGITTADFDRDGDLDLAVSSEGTYRVDVLINGLARPPSVGATTADQLAYETARVSAPVDFRALGGTAVVEYGETTAYGSTTPVQTLAPQAAGDQAVSAVLSELRPERRYHARVVATNGAGTVPGADITFTTTAAPASDLAVGFTGPDLTISGAPRRFTSQVSGSYGPYTYAWNFGKTQGSVDANTANVDHAFEPVARDADPARIKNVGNASDAGEVNTRRGAYGVTLTVTDRFGRTANATRPTTVVPNRAPTTSILPLESPLEYADNALFTSASLDPDDPLDRVFREEWTFGEGSVGVSGLTRDPGPYSKSGRCLPPTAKGVIRCIGPNQSGAAVSANPWRDDRRGLAPIAQLPMIPAIADKTVDWTTYDVQQKVMNYALALYPPAACGSQEGSMAGCWPHKTVEKVKLHAVDGGGRDVTVEREVPIRLRAKPAADVNLVTPGVDTEGGTKEIEQTGPIAAGRPDAADSAGRGTPLTFDPGSTVVDGIEEPVWYSVQIGQPWQASCKGKADILPDLPEPLLTGPAKDQLTTLPPIDQLTGGDPNVLNQIEVEGLSQKGLALAKRNRAKAARLAPGKVAAPVPGSTGSTPVVSSTKKSKCVAGFGVKQPVSTVVSKDPKQLVLTIPKPGEYSALLTVYDRTAATGKVRLDGIKVVAGQFKCSNVTRSIGKGSNKLTWSGTCVDGDNLSDVYWTKAPINVNGVAIAPPDGNWMIVRRDPFNQDRGLIYTASNIPSAASPDAIKAYKPVGTTKPVTFLVDGEAIASTELRLGPPIRIPGSKSSGVRLDQPIVITRPKGSQASYGGLPIVTDVTIDLRAKCNTKDIAFGGSRIDFEVKLPADFASVDPEGKAVPVAPTKPVKVPACNPLDKSVITKVTDTRNYKRTAARLKGVVGWSAPGAKKAKRLAGVPTGSMTLNDIWLGPVFIQNFTLAYDDASKAFTGTGVGELLSKKVTVKVVITDGSLTEASGSVQVEIPLGSTPLLLKRLGFKLVKKNGVTLVGSAQVTTSDGFLVVANGTIELQAEPVSLTLSGTAGLAGGALPLGTATISASDSVGAVSASVGNSIGPFSYAVNVNGAFSADAFNVEGSGRACIFACLGINGVLSSKGIAVCGEIDLWVHTFRPGFGYLYAGNDLNGYLDGCSLGPYRAAVGRIPVSSGGIPQVSASKSQLAVRASLSAGQSQPIVVEEKQKVLSLIARGAPGLPPRVTLTAPPGDTCERTPCSTGRVVTTPVGPEQAANADGYGFTESTNSFVDVDRVKGEVRIAISNPRQGSWTLSADAGSQTVSGV